MAIENIDELRGMLNVALAFHTAAELVEQRIEDAGYRHDDGTRLAATTSRTRREIWMGLKAASHFNLHQSFELFLKFILRLEGTEHGNRHALGSLYEMLSAASREHVDRAYKRAMASMGQVQQTGVAFYYGKEPPSQPPNEEVTTAKQGFEHFDGSMRLHQRRYEYENIGRGEWTVYMIDLSPWFNMLNDMSSYAHRLFRESV